MCLSRLWPRLPGPGDGNCPSRSTGMSAIPVGAIAFRCGIQRAQILRNGRRFHVRGRQIVSAAQDGATFARKQFSLDFVDLSRRGWADAKRLPETGARPRLWHAAAYRQLCRRFACPDCVTQLAVDRLGRQTSGETRHPLHGDALVLGFQTRYYFDARTLPPAFGSSHAGTSRRHPASQYPILEIKARLMSVWLATRARAWR